MSGFVSKLSKTDPVVLEPATLNWTIHRFKSLKKPVESHEFYSSNNHHHKFQLHLNPKTKIFFGTKQVYIFLWPKFTPKKLPFLYRVSILDEANQAVFTQEFLWKNMDFVSYLQNGAAVGYLVNGALKIHCEVLETYAKTNQKKILPEVNVIEIDHKIFSDYQTLLESGHLSDVTCVVSGKEFKVHKNILAARSSVFKAMFSADLVEKKKNRVEIVDVDVDVFEQLLGHIYSGKIPDLKEFGSDLFVAADKYHLDHLKSMCEQSLHSSLTTSSVSTVLLLADMHNAAQLKSKCIECITSNAEAVMATEGWKILLKSSNVELIAELFKDLSLKTKKLLN